MLLVLKFAATLTAAMFAVAALEWAPAYARGTWMQAPLALALVGSATGV